MHERFVILDPRSGRAVPQTGTTQRYSEETAIKLLAKLQRSESHTNLEIFELEKEVSHE
jgi:hypothetical protein